MEAAASTTTPWAWSRPEDKSWIILRNEFLTNVGVGSSGSGKQAVNGLKKLISESYEGSGDTSAHAAQFWSHYFELFDILEEKQSHIVQPVLKEKMKIFGCLFHPGETGGDVELCRWFLAIVTKMIHHDNRDIVKAGFLQYLSLGESEIHPNLQELLLNFLHEQILPLLRDHVGWIFSEAEEYFDITKKFGAFIRNLYQNRNGDSNEQETELEIIAMILRFLVQDGTCKSPAVSYFVVKTLEVVVNNGEVLKCVSSENSWNLPLIEECCFLLSKITSQGLTTVDLFLRREIEEVLLNVFVNRIIPMLNALEESNPSMKNLQWSRSPMMQNILGFCGSIPLEKLIKFAETYSECFAWFNQKCQYFLPSFDSPPEMDCSRFEELNGVQLKGFLRMVCLSVEEMFQNAMKLTIFNALCKELTSNVDVGERFRSLSEALVEYQSLCSERTTANTNSSLSKDSATIKSCADCQEKFIQDLTSLPKIVSQEIFVRKYQSLELLRVLLRSNSDSIIIDEPLLQRFFEGLNPDSTGYIPSCNYTEFLVWKFFPVLTSIPPNRFPNLVSNVFKLFLKDSSTLAKEEWVINDVDLRTEFYQVKFNGLTSFFSSYGSKNAGGGNMLDENLVERSIWNELLHRIIIDVDKAHYGGVRSATKCVRAMMDFLRHCNPDLFKTVCNDAGTITILRDFIDIAWNLVFEMRKTESFWTALEEFTLLIAHPCLDGQQILTTYADKTFAEGETVMGLPLVLMQSLLHTVTNYSEIVTEGVKFNSESCTYQEIIHICFNATLSGLSLPKNMRVSFGLWFYLLQKAEKDSNPISEPIANCIFAKAPMVRLTALSILQILVEKLDNPDFRQSFMERILLFYLDQNDRDLNKRYFANSLIHRRRLRIGQALLVLQPYFNAEQSAVLLHRLLASLSDDNLQPSVRYMTEWIIIRVLVQHDSTWESFFDNCVQYWTNRIGFASRFVSICLHATTTILRQTRDTKQHFVENALLYLTQLAVGHHVTVRSYAQACFQKVYESLRSSGLFPELITKYEVVFISLRAAEKFCLGSSAKMLSAVENDFYIQLFNPVTHYSMEVIFIHLPRISEVANDELPIEWCLSKSGFNIISQKDLSNQAGNLNCLPIKALREMYLQHCKTTWHLRTTPVSGRELGELPIETQIEPGQESKAFATAATPSVNFQKKINPWKTLTVSDSLMDTMNEESTVKKRAAIEDGLIVVASLVDRTPNLGGLCRSCEIFGVSKYVIASLNVLDDLQFRNLAVSSHSWVDIVEVPPRDLHLFLATYKAKGYRVLGIEQAHESTRLNDFVFPKKSLLLLGNEKFGIPPELLHLVDDCLEIPQVGVTRSLNVHVTGALSIWQYSCQHAFK